MQARSQRTIAGRRKDVELHDDLTPRLCRGGHAPIARHCVRPGKRLGRRSEILVLARLLMSKRSTEPQAQCIRS